MLSTFAVSGRMTWRDYANPESCLTWMARGGAEVEVQSSSVRRTRFSVGGSKPLCLFPAGEYGYVDSTEAARRGLALMVSSGDVCQILDKEDVLPELVMFREAFSDVRLIRLMTALWHAQQPESADCWLAEYLRGSIVHRLLEAEGRLPSHGDCGKFSPSMRRLIESIVAENLAFPLSISSLATVAGVSASHFQLLFARTFETSVHQYVLQARVSSAMRMIRDDIRPAQEIALETGFSSAAHLSSCFKRLTGHTPKAFRAISTLSRQNEHP